ncbi:MULTISPECIES: hypothetical protein [unclassified Xanthomonas]|uniref:hypothetical protein n=1 Tax=unclassified Xanthomonas TaxID=2643310 RepID=UPI001F3DBBBF|nr:MULTISPECIES: hypothetical protein [unclassified Xanthomonas]
MNGRREAPVFLRAQRLSAPRNMLPADHAPREAEQCSAWHEVEHAEEGAEEIVSAFDVLAVIR